jgi:nucleotide-binding universal stress UspA family protein
MFQHLLLPLDGSRLAEAAIAPARALARRLGSRVTLLHVLERNAPAQVHGERHLTDPKEAERYLEGVAEAFTGDGVAVTWHSHDVAEAGVAQSITAHAAEYGCDLVVLATHGSGGMLGQFIGTIAQQVIGFGSTPVLVIHPEAAPGEFACQRMVVPLDEAAEHESSVPVALEMARCFGGGVHLLTAVPRRADLAGSRGAVGRMLPTAMSALLDVQEHEAFRRLQGLALGMADQGVQATFQVQRGEPAGVILQTLAQRDADLLVMATHTRRGWAAFWAGSVAPKVLAQWQRPILLVRAAPHGPKRG